MDTGTVVIAFIATIILTALVFTPLCWPLGFMLWVGTVAVSLLVVVRWHAGNTVYRCRECDHLFSISSVTDLVSPHGLDHGGGWKLLTCPKCRRYGEARVYMKDSPNKGA